MEQMSSEMFAVFELAFMRNQNTELEIFDLRVHYKIIMYSLTQITTEFRERSETWKYL